VERVRIWRRNHPGYWKKRRRKDFALQDEIPVQPTDLEGDPTKWVKGALQDEILLQPALLVGLISNWVGSALQEDIASAVQHLHLRGQQILGGMPGELNPGAKHAKTNSVFSATAASAPAIQLGGSTSGAP
jgi:hypothetical protein